MSTEDLMKLVQAIPGGYVYHGIVSTQICFPLKAGGELRFMSHEDDEPEVWRVDHYGSELPPGITGFVEKTGT